ncbi:MULTISPECIES: hypothetical protein [Sphingobacterium]|uniref:hypothetical protein n=1 Tax=Sphingobacterium TaxID=28453 RepID=UPI00257A02E1|nr:MULTISPECIES: hypothetical protein [Sphingobacterium]
MKEPIGIVIKDSIRQSGMTQEDFANDMGMTLRNLANLFGKEHIPMEQLARASKIMKRDFITEYVEWLHEKTPEIKEYENFLHKEYLDHEQSGIANNQRETPELISIALNVKGSIESVSANLSELISVVKREAETRGFKLT